MSEVTSQESLSSIASSNRNSNGGDDDNILASYNIAAGTKNVRLNIVRGSVLDFDKHSNKRPNNVGTAGNISDNDNENDDNKKESSAVAVTTTMVGAIVNAANESCLSGGGVDGAISDAGGEALFQDRWNLPILNGDKKGYRRCHVGDAKITGPNQYGSLHVPYVIHAVGPDYGSFEEFAAPDHLLRSAYRSSLDRCCGTAADTATTTTTITSTKRSHDDNDNDDDNKISTIAAAATTTTSNSVAKPEISRLAFSLLSAGIFRGSRSLYEVLSIGITAIRDWLQEKEKQQHSLTEISLFAFTTNEAKILIRICDKEL